MIIKTLIAACMMMAIMAGEAFSQKMKLGMDDFKHPVGGWYEAGDAILDPADDRRLEPIAGEGVFINGDQGRIENLVIKKPHGDVKIELEFMMAKRSNSGVYLQGRYEIQILDSYGKENPSSGDCGGIYARYDGTRTFEGTPPLVNASKEPGVWQHYEIWFMAPRFNAAGEKTKNAIFKKVKLNGVIVQRNTEVTGPTASSLDNEEGPLGTLMLQGDHGPVAYRNIRIKRLGRKF